MGNTVKRRTCLLFDGMRWATLASGGHVRCSSVAVLGVIGFRMCLLAAGIGKSGSRAALLIGFVTLLVCVCCYVGGRCALAIYNIGAPLVLGVYMLSVWLACAAYGICALMWFAEYN